MPDDLERFFKLRAEYNAVNSLGKAVLLDRRFTALESEIESHSVKIAIRKFIAEEKAAAKKRHEEYMAEYQQKRDTEIEKRLAVLKQWSLGDVSRTAARGLIRASTWWLTHSSGTPVRAPGHDYRMEQKAWGWSIEFGANHFLIGRAIQRAAPILIDGFSLLKVNQIPNEKYFDQKIQAILPSCVGNYNYDGYENYAPTNGRLIFGAQAIDLTDATNYIIRASGLSNHFLTFPVKS